ncbi:hypothetical protein LSH36_27g08059 [Paralvinella palmiformis]|uniref:Uncharacterized protein n=1 Tax=Paralvinella palmiformis TaxID=53620 RepID=A0AAD9KAE5_9ANNE|nr:hypothetical protein LSH36_27g08059 [Paralvinella palmiformis]
MWTNRSLEEFSLGQSAADHHHHHHRHISTVTPQTHFNMDKSVFARVLKVIIQCVEEGSALLQTFKMEGDVSNTRITIEFQSYEVHTGAMVKPDGGSGQNGDDSHGEQTGGKKHAQFHSASQSPPQRLAPGSDKHSPFGGSQTTKSERPAENPNRDAITSVMLLKERNGQNLQERLHQSLVEIEKSELNDAAEKAKERKSRARQKGVNLEQVIHDQNCIQPMTDALGRSELCDALKQLDYGKKKPKGRNPFAKSRSLDDLDSPESNFQTSTPRQTGAAPLANGTDQTHVPCDTRPKTVTFTSPQVVDRPAITSHISGELNIEGRSYDADDYKGSGG